MYETSILTLPEFSELQIHNLEGDISAFPQHSKQPYVQSINLITENSRIHKIDGLVNYWGDFLGRQESVAQWSTLNELNWMYLYCTYFGFLDRVKDVDINIYARTPVKRSPQEAYERLSSLTPMSESQVSSLFSEQPVILNEDNMVIDGVHRACAMMGRLIVDKAYLPVHAIRISDDDEAKSSSTRKTVTL